MFKNKEIGGYLRTSKEAENNCVEIKNYLLGKGWTINAICGLLGNIECESGYNPARWEQDKVCARIGIADYKGGYGLVQFTPAKKYYAIFPEKVHFSSEKFDNEDGFSQLAYISSQPGFYKTKKYPENYNEFVKSSKSPEYLASVFLYNYERPKNPENTEKRRQEAARYWYNIFTGKELLEKMPLKTFIANTNIQVYCDFDFKSKIGTISKNDEVSVLYEATKYQIVAYPTATTMKVGIIGK